MTVETSPSWRGQWLGWIGLSTLIFFNLLPSAYSQMVNFPHILVWQIGFLCLGIWGIWMLRQFKVPFQPLGYGLDWGVGIILLALGFSVAFAEFQEVAAKNFSIALGYAVLLYTLRNWLLYSRLTWQKLGLGLSILGSIVGVWSLILWLPEADFQFLRNPEPLGHHNVVASYILLVFPIILSYTFCYKGWQRWLGLLICAELLFTFYTTGSRGGLVGLFALIFAGACLLIFNSKGQKRNLFLTSFIVILIVLSWFVFTNTRFESLVELNWNNDQAPLVEIQADGQVKDRFLMWQAGGNILQERPVFGVGIGNMSRVYNLYRPIEAGTGASTVQHLHSTPMQILGETGVLGVVAVTILIGFLVRLWWRLYRTLNQTHARYLLYGIAGSLIGYSASVLTDYQLENIGISGTIVVLLVLLLALADESNLESVLSFSIPYRRGVSLVSIGFLSLACFAAFPLTVAMGIHQQGESFLQQNQASKAFNWINAASNIVPWEPVYSIHLGQRFLKLRETAKADDKFKQFSEISIEYLQQGVDAAPNDQWFHHTLGLAYYPINPKKAEEAFSRVVELLPRGNFYNYYLLALSYIETNQPREKIITALALQGLVKPEFLTVPVWQTNQELSQLKDAVVAKTLGYFETLQSRLTPDTKQYNHVYELEVLLRWWHNQPLEEIEVSRLRPIIQALLVAENSPEEALTITQSALENKPNDSSLLLLRAWLKPDQYLESYLAQSQLFQNWDTEIIQNYMEQYDNPRRWLSSLQPQSIPPRTRKALIYTYRNYDVRFIGSIPSPLDLNYYPIVNSLEMFADYPRELLPLEYLVNDLQRKQLELKDS